MFDVSFTLDAFPDATPKDICVTEIVLQRNTHRLQISLHSAFCNNEKDLFAWIIPKTTQWYQMRLKSLLLMSLQNLYEAQQTHYKSS